MLIKSMFIRTQKPLWHAISDQLEKEKSKLEKIELRGD